jgi:hypothetical protein
VGYASRLIPATQLAPTRDGMSDEPAKVPRLWLWCVYAFPIVLTVGFVVDPPMVAGILFFFWAMLRAILRSLFG